MIIERVSPLTGEINTMDLDITQEQLDAFYNGSELIQHAFPNLTADEREFILTGITPDEWNAMFDANVF